MGYSHVEQSYVSDSRAVVSANPIGDFNNWDGTYAEPVYGARNVDIDQDNRQSGLYAAMRLSATDSLKFVLGGRLAKWEETGLSYGSPVDYGVPGTIFEASRAAKGTVSEGVELEVVGRPVDGWETSASFTAFTAKDAQDVNVNTSQPRRMFKLFSTYDFQDRLRGLTVGGGINWEGNNYIDTTNPISNGAERLEQDAYTLVSLMARYDFSQHLTAQFNVDNLLEEDYYGQIGFYNQLSFGEPRNYNVSFSYRF